VLRKNRQRERKGEGEGADSERTRKTNSSENTLVYTQHRRDVFRGLFRARKRISFCERSFLSLPRLFLSREISLSFSREHAPAGFALVPSRKQRGIAFCEELPVYQAMQNSRGVTRVDYTRLIIAACDTACNAATFRRRAEARGPIITIGARSESREQGKGSIFFRPAFISHIFPRRGMRSIGSNRSALLRLQLFLTTPLRETYESHVCAWFESDME